MSRLELSFQTNGSATRPVTAADDTYQVHMDLAISP